jgi:flagellar hook-associated protein 3 FlgL
MTRISVGDASLTNILARQSADLRAQVNRASQEVATGRPADLSGTLRGDISPLLAIDASLTRLQAFKTTAQDAALQTAQQQAALSGLSSLAEGITTTLLGARNFQTQQQIGAVGADAEGRLQSAVGLLNTQAAGRAVFSGNATDRVPLGSADDLLAALEMAIVGATSAGMVAAAVVSWFADPLGYEAFYRGGAPLSAAPIASGETADLSTTATDPAIRDTLAGFAMAALINRGVLAGNPEERALLAQRAGQELLTTADTRITLSARIGAVEAQVEAARARNGAEESALGILRSNIGSVDLYEAATRLEAARSQLESIYMITARAARLSLVEFLR